MKRLLLVPLVVATALVLFAVPAMADSPHYIKGPKATVQGNSLVVAWKAAGLGNTVTSVDFNLTGTVNTTSQCFTKSGNPVNGVPKSETINVNATGTFPVRNGQTTGSLTVAPISTLQCPDNELLRLLPAVCDLTLGDNEPPPVHLAGWGLSSGCSTRRIETKGGGGFFCIPPAHAISRPNLIYFDLKVEIT